MVIFRADGNSAVGLGHVMRNLSIADAFKKAGEQCCFLLADDGLSDLINSRGYAARVLGTQFDHMDDEARRFQTVIHGKDIRAIFVDSYYVTDYYLKTLHNFCNGNGIILVYVDDVLRFPYPCDVLINYNIYASEADYQELYRGHGIPELILGTSYAPLRAEFQSLPNRIVRVDAKEILISTGGADFEHIGMELVKTIVRHGEWSGYRFHFVVGSMNEDKDRIESLVRKQENIKLHKNVGKMSVLMQSCDVAVSAAGSTIYELCLTQTPTITYILADNQIPGAKGFEEKGILSNAGDIRNVGLERLTEDILSRAVGLAKDYDERCKIVGKMGKVVDGQGAERIEERVMRMVR